MKILEAIKKYALLIGGAVVGVLYLLLQIERGKRKDAEGQVISAEHDKKDAVLADRQATVEAEREKVIAEAEAEKGRKLTPEEMEDFLGKL